MDNALAYLLAGGEGDDLRAVFSPIPKHAVAAIVYVAEVYVELSTECTEFIRDGEGRRAVALNAVV